MCTYNIKLDDKLVSDARSSFASDDAMRQWIERQVESLLARFNSKQRATIAKARRAIESMRKQSERNGNSNMTLEEINQEIRQARASRNALS